MFTLLIFATYALAFAEPSDIYCCSTEQGVLQDGENICFNDATNTTTPTNLACSEAEQISDLEVNITSLINMLQEHHDSSMYCIANKTSNSTERVVVICAEEDKSTVDDYVLGICIFVSVIFLVPTVLVYSLLPEIRDLQGKSIIQFCGTLAIALVILGCIKMTISPDMASCAARAFLVYFFFLAAFFWMNAISIQILLNIRRPTISDYGWKQFLWYALYAYGLPILFTTVMAIVNYNPGHHSKPGIGLNTCWFRNEKQQWFYMYSVMSVLLTANICIFIYISLYLWRGSFSSSNIKALRYKFVMTVRLLIIMGLPWIFEMISSLSPPHIIWAITDILNVLQGPLIFLVLVVFRKRVVKALFKRGYLDCISGLVERHLAVGDDEENVAEHTMAEALEFNDK